MVKLPYILRLRIDFQLVISLLKFVEQIWLIIEENARVFKYEIKFDLFLENNFRVKMNKSVYFQKHG